MIDSSTIQRIFDTADIVDVISDFVNLKKAGTNFKGLSPFTNERTPSFVVSPAKQIFKCFSSGKGGSVVSFLMEHEKLSYPDALRFLAKKYNIEIEERPQTDAEKQQESERESLMVISQFAQKHFKKSLHESEEGKAIGLSYFKEREFRDDIIEKFGLGYAKGTRDNFTQNALAKGFKLDLLDKTGLTINKENGKPFDRFYGRVIFPIHSISGNVIGFGGRILGKNEKAAKYLNSPESPIYHKSKILYGLFFAKQAITKADRCFIVEGYTDVTSMHQAGIENVVASSGTALSKEQIRLIKRFTNNITMIFDGDAAGIKASFRGIDLILEEGLNVRVVLLPDGEDPDSMSKKVEGGPFSEYIDAHEEDFITFKTKLLSKDGANDPVARANMITDVVKSIALIPDTIKRAVYIKESSQILDLAESFLYEEITKVSKRKSDNDRIKERYEQEQKSVSSAQVQGKRMDEQLDVLEKDIIRLLMNYGNHVLFSDPDEGGNQQETNVIDYIVGEFVGDEIELDTDAFKDIFMMFQNALANGNYLNERFFINHEDTIISKAAADLLSDSYDLSRIWSKDGGSIETEEMKLKLIVPETIIAYKNKKILDSLTEIQQAMLEAQKKGDDDKVLELQQKVVALNQVKQALSKNLGNRILLR